MFRTILSTGADMVEAGLCCRLLWSKDLDTSEKSALKSKTLLSDAIVFGCLLTCIAMCARLRDDKNKGRRLVGEARFRQIARS
jgi:hypothetical protein